LGQKSSPFPRFPLKLRPRIKIKINLTLQLVFKISELRSEGLSVRASDNHQIDIRRGLFLALRVGAVNESEPNSGEFVDELSSDFPPPLLF